MATDPMTGELVNRIQGALPLLPAAWAQVRAAEDAQLLAAAELNNELTRNTVIDLVIDVTEMLGDIDAPAAEEMRAGGRPGLLASLVDDAIHGLVDLHGLTTADFEMTRAWLLAQSAQTPAPAAATPAWAARSGF